MGCGGRIPIVRPGIAIPASLLILAVLLSACTLQGAPQAPQTGVTPVQPPPPVPEENLALPTGEVAGGVPVLPGNVSQGEAGGIPGAGQATTGAGPSGNTTTASGTCLLHTRNNPECKDCCDCLDGDAALRKDCRDACAVHDFGTNTGFISVSPFIAIGPGGNYSACTGRGLVEGTVQACKECCDGSPALACGDRRFCRDTCNAMAASGKLATAPGATG